MRWLVMLAAAVIFTAGCDKKVVKTGEKTTLVHVSKMEKRLFQERIPLQGTVQPVVYAVISAKIFKVLEENGIQTQFIDLPEPNIMIAKKLEMIPIEVIVRNII